MQAFHMMDERRASLPMNQDGNADLDEMMAAGGSWKATPLPVGGKPSSSQVMLPGKPDEDGLVQAWRIPSIPDSLSTHDLASAAHGLQASSQQNYTRNNYSHEAVAMPSPASSAHVQTSDMNRQPWTPTHADLVHPGLEAFGAGNSGGFMPVDPSQLLSRWSTAKDPSQDLSRLDFSNHMDSLRSGNPDPANNQEHLLLQQAAAAWGKQPPATGGWPLDHFNNLGPGSSTGGAVQGLPQLATSQSSPINALPDVLDGPTIVGPAGVGGVGMGSVGGAVAGASISAGGAVPGGNGSRRSVACIARDDSNKLATVATLGASFQNGGLAGGSPWSTPTASMAAAQQAQQDKLLGGTPIPMNRNSSPYMSVVGFGDPQRSPTVSRSSMPSMGQGDDITDSQLLGVLSQMPGWQQLGHQDRVMLLHAAHHEMAVQQQQQQQAAQRQQVMAEVVMQQLLQQQQQQQPGAAAAASSAMLGLPPSPLKGMRSNLSSGPQPQSPGFGMGRQHQQQVESPMRMQGGMGGMGMNEEQMLHMMQAVHGSVGGMDDMGWGQQEVAQLLTMHPQAHHGSGAVPPGAHSPTSLLHGDYSLGGNSRSSSYQGPNSGQANNNNSSNGFARMSRHSFARQGPMSSDEPNLAGGLSSSPHNSMGLGALSSNMPGSSGGAAGVRGGRDGLGRDMKLPHKLVMSASQVGLSSQALWALLRHPSLLDMLIKERDALRGGPTSASASTGGMTGNGSGLGSKVGLGMDGRGAGPSVSGGGSVTNTPVKRAGAGAMSGGGAVHGSEGSSHGGTGAATLPTLDPVRRQEEMSKVQRLLVDLMTSTATYLHSSQVQTLLAALGPVASLYDSMHELPVVQKRKRCQEMGEMRAQLMQQQALKDTVQLLATLRHHLHTLTSRLLLLADSSSEGVPLDILLGCMCSELLGLLKPCLSQDILDVFEGFLPHARLALLVFVEFTSVDPAPPK